MKLLSMPLRLLPCAQKLAKPFLPDEPAGVTRSTLNRTVLERGLPCVQADLLRTEHCQLLVCLAFTSRSCCVHAS